MYSKRTAAQKKADTKLCWELRELGYSQSQIAEILNKRAERVWDEDNEKWIEPEVNYKITQQTICNDLKPFEEALEIKNEDELKKLKIKILNTSLLRQELVIKQAFKEFERSKQARKKTGYNTENFELKESDLGGLQFEKDFDYFKDKILNLPANKIKKHLQTEYREANPKFLNVVLNAIDQMNRLLGNFPKEYINTDTKPIQKTFEERAAELGQLREQYQSPEPSDDTGENEDDL